MTYFQYRRIRGTRSEEVVAGSRLVGRVTLKADWRARLALRPGDDGYQAARTDGTVLPRLYRSRHDAAEALYEGLVEPVEPREPGDALSA